MLFRNLVSVAFAARLLKAVTTNCTQFWTQCLFKTNSITLVKVAAHTLYCRYTQK